MGAAMVSALLTVSMQVEEKVGDELSKFGPNLIIFPKTETIPISVGGVELGSVTEQKYIEENDLKRIEEIKYSKNVRGIRGIAPYLYALVKVNDQSDVVLVGTFLDQARNINTWWSLEGEWIKSRNDTINSLVGVSVAEKLDFDIGDFFKIKYSSIDSSQDGNITYIESEHTFRVSGILTAGSDDDNRIFINLDVLQNLTAREDKISTIQVTALCNKCSTDVIAEEIEEKLPYIEAKTVKQVAETQMQLLAKIQYMMLLITIIALLASALGVMTTMTTSVVERTREIGMMKAIGAEDRKVAMLFLSEALIIGLIGGVLGFILGIYLAQYVGESVFHSPIEPMISILPIIIGISIGITIISSSLPVRRALKIEPAEVIRTV
jgi:putative ABC transport system permease protein